MFKRRFGLIAVLLSILPAMLGVSAGCGGSVGDAKSTAASGSGGLDQLDAQAILDKAKAAATAATGVHVEAVGTADGQPIAIDVDFHKGSGSAGSYEADGLKFDLVFVGGNVYAKGNDAFYRTVMGTSYNETSAGLIAGKYLKAPVSDAPKLDLIAFFGDMEAFLTQTLEPAGTIAKAARRTVDGIDTVGLTSTAGGMLYVANDGSDLPLLFDGPAYGYISLTKWGKVAAVVAPPADQVLDFGELIN